MTDRPALRALADRVGILGEYVDQTGRETRVTSDRTREALLAALGIEAAGEADARRSLERLEREARERMLEPVRVLRDDERTDAALRVELPEGLARDGDRVGWSLRIRCEDGDAVERAGHAAAEGEALTVPLPATLPWGYHQLQLRVETHDGALRDAEQTLVVVPGSCPTPAQRLHGGRVFGITANLYAVRSERNWGVGDLTDLRELLAWAGEIGAGFVGVNPLHALRNRGADVSPYGPVSRLFRNPLYLDVTAVPELAESEDARALLESERVTEQLAALRESEHVQYAEAMALKRRLLEPLHRTFAARHRFARTERGDAYRRYVAAQGDALDDFATWMALDERAPEMGWPASWREWPEPFRDPRSDAVRRFRDEHDDAVDLHRWMQFELDRQLEAAARTARAVGLPLGLYPDLAIGSAPTGSDPWAFPGLFVFDASVGAPPDEYSESGQNWGLPPLHPLRLREDRYRYWVQLLRSAFRHAGALRIDHVIGLFRQFWIPSGMAGKDGAYVRFPTHDLLGILALESARAGALVVGEDLGTVPPEVGPTLKAWGVLSSKVLYFERDADGDYLPAAHYEALSLTTANTHDMATLDGFWRGRDVELRRHAGIIDDAGAERARAERARERRALVERLAADGALPAPEMPADSETLRGAVHDFLCRTPAALVGLSLDDVAGETDPVNLPGVGPEAYPSWRRRMALPLERYRDDPGVRRALARCAELRPPHEKREAEHHQHADVS